ncbi:MAG: Slp family lipoprotein [Methylohalobius sp.]|nr:Slp family lipoprotein [Methylohalobius sp.]
MKPMYLLGLFLLLSACATMPPELAGVAESPSLDEVAAQPESFRGRRIRWGGTIIEVSNEADATFLQILAKPLDRTGRPEEDATPQGRFLMRTEQFLDPAIYLREREITVVGTGAGIAERQIGKRSVKLPLLEAERWHLWPKRERTPVYYPYWWYYPYPMYYRYGWPYWWW